MKKQQKSSTTLATELAEAERDTLPVFEWGYLPHDLGRVLNALNLKLLQSLRPVGLSIPQFRVMQFLRRVESTSIGGICELTLIEQSVVSRIVIQLEERGFVTRTRNPRNARRVDVSLTHVGQVVLESLTPAAQAITEGSVSNLNKQERRQLTALLEKVYEARKTLDEEDERNAHAQQT